MPSNTYNRLVKMAQDPHTIDPGFMDAQQAMQRAMRGGSKGVGQFMANSELIGDRLKGQLGGVLLGGGGGALAGGLAGALAGRGGAGPGAAIGAGIGALTGQVAGGMRADKKYLLRKGISPKAYGLGGAKFTPEAAARYGISKEDIDSAKTGSVAEYGDLFNLAADGHFGEDTKEALAGICAAYDKVNLSSAEKVASIHQENNVLSESDARHARLDQLLRR